MSNFPIKMNKELYSPLYQYFPDELINMITQNLLKTPIRKVFKYLCYPHFR